MHGETKKDDDDDDDDEGVNDCIKGNEVHNFVKACFANHCD